MLFRSRRGGLDHPCWLIVDEYNRVATDALESLFERVFYAEPVSTSAENAMYDLESPRPVGAFSAAFLRKVAARIKRTAVTRRVKAVVRR